MLSVVKDWLVGDDSAIYACNWNIMRQRIVWSCHRGLLQQSREKVDIIISCQRFFTCVNRLGDLGYDCLRDICQKPKEFVSKQLESLKVVFVVMFCFDVVSHGKANCDS